MNRENVIKGLETIKQFFGYGLPSTAEMFDSYYGILNDAIAMLKEQEAVDPICQVIFDVPYYFCGSCKTMLNMYAVKAKYCSNCARRVKWD